MALIAGILLLVPPGAAAADPQEALIRGHLDAGEFAPALAIARNAPTPAQRDAWLARVAVAQAAAGDRRAALGTAAEISDDRSRSAALSRVSAQPLGGRGGGAEPDFESLIELITSTIAPQSWDEVGGPGSIAAFPNGVYVDARGVLQPLLRRETSGRLAALRQSSAAAASRENVRRSSPLRKVSLPRLERHVQWRLAAGRQPTEAMHALAGLQRVKYLLVYPDSRDIVLAGPAGDWTLDAEDRLVGTESGRPVLRLDDLVVVLRHMTATDDARFGCTIDPRQANLARTHAFLKQSSKKPLAAGARARKAWLEEVRAHVGTQDIKVYGLDARTRAARVMVEADYRMKLVGMGLEKGVDGVQSYLASVKIPPGQAPPPLQNIRWWFTLNYQAVLAAENRMAFEIRGQGVKVLSENQFLTATGKQIHTGKSEPLTRKFAESFTAHFEALCRKYPVYAELRNIFDLALVGALIREEDLLGKTGWHMSCLGDAGAYQVELGAAPKTVETVINHRMIRGPTRKKVHILAGVSGGVSVDPSALVDPKAIEIDSYGTLDAGRSTAAPKQSPLEAWWWD